MLLQVYNWTEDGSTIVCNAFKQADYTRYSFIFPAFYTQVIPLSDTKEFEEKNGQYIFHVSDVEYREAVYGSRPMGFKKYYTSKRLYDSKYYSGKSLYDIFFNHSRINPSSYIDLDRVTERFDLKHIKSNVRGLDVDEYILYLKFEEIQCFAECCYNPRVHTSITPVPLNIMAFDIEVYFDNGGIVFVSPTKDSDQIICISTMMSLNSAEVVEKFLQTYTSEVISLEAHKNNLSISFAYYPFDPKSEIEILSDSTIVIHCLTEADVINGFVKLFMWVDPHHVTGHNVIDFDFKFLQNRIEHLASKGHNVQRILLRKHLESKPTSIVIRAINSIKGNRSITDNSGNILILDYMNYAKKYKKTMQSFSLEVCANTSLSWKSKVRGVKVVDNIPYLACELPINEILKLENTEYLKVIDLEEVVPCLWYDDEILLQIPDIESQIIPQQYELAHCKAAYDLVDAFSDYTHESHRRCISYCNHDSKLSLALYRIEDVSNSIFTI